jgi:rare lipoprotein A
MAARIVIGLSARSIVPMALLCAVTYAQPAEQGLASWYRGPLDGPAAASGETDHQEQLTAAHRTLPLGTTVRIRRLDTGASVVVLINDRGPFIGSRLIDLSIAAARKLDMFERGVVPVALEILHAAADTGLRFAVQAGTFRILANAEHMRTLMERLYGLARILPRAPDSEVWSVLVGAAPTQAEAETLAAAIRKRHGGLQSAFVVRLAGLALPVTE